jgi:CDGSH-type Zn-finger protein
MAIVNNQQVPCGCGRSATGFCTGLHELTDEEWDRMLLEDMGLQDSDEEDDPL